MIYFSFHRAHVSSFMSETVAEWKSRSSCPKRMMFTVTIIYKRGLSCPSTHQHRIDSEFCSKPLNIDHPPLCLCCWGLPGHLHTFGKTPWLWTTLYNPDSFPKGRSSTSSLTKPNLADTTCTPALWWQETTTNDWLEPSQSKENACVLHSYQSLVSGTSALQCPSSSSQHLLGSLCFSSSGARTPT